jgi:hypothetical protein
MENRSWDELEHQLAAGGRFVQFEFCISLLLMTLRRPSGVYWLAPGELGLWRGMPFTLISLVLGWWGLPWGIIYTPLVLLTNLSGGRDVTPEVRAWMQETAAAGGSAAPAELATPPELGSDEHR